VSDDLVVRLRERCKWYRERAQEHQHVAALREARNVEALLLEEAADEIERLQSDLAAQGDAPTAATEASAYRSGMTTNEGEKK
jgi:hypothetical protein